MDIQTYNNLQTPEDQKICNLLAVHIDMNLTDMTSKIRHGHPVRFANGNPIVGYSKQKAGICLLFWSGKSFGEVELLPEGKFQAAQIIYTDTDQIDIAKLKIWLQKSIAIQRDYKNIVKRKGILERLV